MLFRVVGESRLSFYLAEYVIMNGNIFQIRNLRCEYRPGVPVLHLRELDLPAGQLVFIIGKSGIGKSTFIETLGLMNRTIANFPETSVLFSPDGKEKASEMKNCWALSNQELSTFRRKHFSFIFQNTNLMPNFTSGENMMVSLLIEGRSYAEAKQEVLSVMDSLSLSRDVFDKKITEISGGQRQRLAFVRAITADFTILFGDEPTGNLDKNTSEELIGIIRDMVRDKGRTSVIVSHDLGLADKFADMIIPITVEKSQDTHITGGVEPANILRRTDSGWMKKSGEQLSDTTAYLNQFLLSS